MAGDKRTDKNSNELAGNKKTIGQLPETKNGLRVDKLSVRFFYLAGGQGFEP